MSCLSYSSLHNNQATGATRMVLYHSGRVCVFYTFFNSDVFCASVNDALQNGWQWSWIKKMKGKKQVLFSESISYRNPLRMPYFCLVCSDKYFHIGAYTSTHTPTYTQTNTNIDLLNSATQRKLLSNQLFVLIDPQSIYSQLNRLAVHGHWGQQNYSLILTTHSPTK